MKKRILASMLCLAMSLSLVTVGAFAADEATAAADALYELGLFSGTGTNEDGSPIYDLDRTPTRNEAVTMLVRLLGKEDEAKAGSWETPFTDVDEWAKPYVGYAYANKLTTGTSDSTFGGTATVSPSQYLTFVLRALGYESGTDFQWDKAWKLSDELGITHGEYGPDSAFSRGDVALISHGSLSAPLKEGGKTLIEELGLGKHPGETTPTPTPTPTPLPTPSAPVDLELKNDGGSTGIDPQKPVESAPPISEIEIPSGKGLQVGESDEGLTEAGTTSSFAGNETHIIESEKYVEVADDIIGTVTSMYNKQPEVEIRVVNVTIPMYIGDTVNIDCKDLGYPDADNIWWFVFGTNDCVSVSGDETQVCTITAKKPISEYCVAELRLPHDDMSYEEIVSLNVVVYDKKPSSMVADFTLTTDFEPIYYCKGAIRLHTDKGETYNGTNGSTLDWNDWAVDVVRIKPKANSSIPKSAIGSDGYVLMEEVDKYYSITTNDAEDWSLTASEWGVVMLRVPNSGQKVDKVVTVTVTSLKDGRSCSIDLMVRYE